MPEAQLDRFLFNTVLDYLSAEEESRVIDHTTTTHTAQIEAVTDAAGAAGNPEPGPQGADRGVCGALRGGVGARDALQKRVRAADRKEVRELWRQRTCCPVHRARRQGTRAYRIGATTSATKTSLRLAIPVLRHRILLNFHAESDRIDADEILRQLIAQLPPPRG